ncbi:ROK family protein [Microbacterium sp. P04]|uniref:ROK family protein n=1 Tax=Microbacterium sp. P04 TaxID=3366947 RepID=UPI0037450782
MQLNIERPVLAFDVGGTWLRSAVVSSQFRLSAVTRDATEKLRSDHDREPHHMAERLVTWISTVRDRHPDIHDVGISLGAVYDAKKGTAVSSAPLWGAKRIDFPFRDALREASRTPTRWAIANDVTAAALAARAHDHSLVGAPFHLITLSSGVAARRVDEKGLPATDNVNSPVQGEIGHLPARFLVNEHPIHQRCECGQNDHVASFLSGRGFTDMLRSSVVLRPVIGSPPSPSDGGDIGLVGRFVDAVEAKHSWALSILDALVGTLLDTIDWIVTVDPTARIVLTGGFFRQIDRVFTSRLLSVSEQRGPYAIGEDRTWLRSRLGRFEDPNAGLMGAAFHARRAVSAQSTLESI